MINFKKLINKRKSENERIELYNSIINENLDNIKNIFKLSHLRISTHNELDGSIALLIDNGYEGDWFKYETKFKDNNLFNKKTIEKSLENFIENNAQHYNIRMNNKIYYAHHLYKYDTKIEEYELELISKILSKYDVLNPNGEIEHEDLSNEQKIMEKCLSEISKDNVIGVVFSSISGVIGKGVYDEVNHALSLGKDVYYIYNNAISKCSNISFELTNQDSRRFYAIVQQI
jgi:hypothetical protein